MCPTPIRSEPSTPGSEGLPARRAVPGSQPAVSRDTRTGNGPAARPLPACQRVKAVQACGRRSTRARSPRPGRPTTSRARRSAPHRAQPRLASTPSTELTRPSVRSTGLSSAAPAPAPCRPQEGHRKCASRGPDDPSEAVSGVEPGGEDDRALDAQVDGEGHERGTDEPHRPLLAQLRHIAEQSSQSTTVEAPISISLSKPKPALTACHYPSTAKAASTDDPGVGQPGGGPPGRADRQTASGPAPLVATTGCAGPARVIRPV